jgi:hypothetical protein
MIVGNAQMHSPRIHSLNALLSIQAKTGSIGRQANCAGKRRSSPEPAIRNAQLCSGTLAFAVRSDKPGRSRNRKSSQSTHPSLAKFSPRGPYARCSLIRTRVSLDQGAVPSWRLFSKPRLTWWETYKILRHARNTASTLGSKKVKKGGNKDQDARDPPCDHRDLRRCNEASVPL